MIAAPVKTGENKRCRLSKRNKQKPSAHSKNAREWKGSGREPERVVEEKKPKKSHPQTTPCLPFKGRAQGGYWELGTIPVRMSNLCVAFAILLRTCDVPSLWRLCRDSRGGIPGLDLSGRGWESDMTDSSRPLAQAFSRFPPPPTPMTLPRTDGGYS